MQEIELFMYIFHKKPDGVFSWPIFFPPFALVATAYRYQLPYKIRTAAPNYGAAVLSFF